MTPVNGDKVPMAPGFGQQPQFIVSIQPVGTVFNPPAVFGLGQFGGFTFELEDLGRNSLQTLAATANKLAAEGNAGKEESDKERVTHGHIYYPPAFARASEIFLASAARGLSGNSLMSWSNRRLASSDV